MAPKSEAAKDENFIVDEKGSLWKRLFLSFGQEVVASLLECSRAGDDGPQLWPRGGIQPVFILDSSSIHAILATIPCSADGQRYVNATPRLHAVIQPAGLHGNCRTLDG